MFIYVDKCWEKGTYDVFYNAENKRTPTEASDLQPAAVVDGCPCDNNGNAPNKDDDPNNDGCELLDR